MVTSTGVRESKKELTAATKLDEKIRHMAHITEQNMSHLCDLLRESKNSGSWKLITDADGKPFTSWKLYVADVALKDMPGLHAISRNALIRFLVDEGLTIRDAAAATGTSPATAGRAAQGKPTGEGTTAAETSGTTSDSKGPQARTSTLADRATKSLEAVRAKVNDRDKLPTADLRRLQKELQHTLSDVIEAMQVREAIARHPAGSQGTNPRTGAVTPGDVAAKGEQVTAKVDQAA